MGAPRLAAGIVLPCLLASGWGWSQVGSPPNVALHKAYTLQPAPNYGPCTDTGDAAQLTDGVYTDGHFWTRPTTVGWAAATPVQITIDLQQEEPIAGLSYSTAAGAAGVAWPWSIVVLTSSDGGTWFHAGDLARLDRQARASELTSQRFSTMALKTRGRYVRLLVGKLPYTFVDEIEVYRGRDEWLTDPPAGSKVTDMDDAALMAQGVNAMLERLRADLAAARAALDGSGLAEADRDELMAVAEGLAREIEALPDELPPDFTTLMPFSDLQARIFALHSPARRTAGYAPVTVWEANRWDPLVATEAPVLPPRTPTDLSVRVMTGEHRATALNVTNSSDQRLTATLSVRGLPGGDNPAFVSVREVQFTETYTRQVISAALPVAERAPEGHQIHIPAGMTRQIWFDVCPVRVPPGNHEGTVMIAVPGQPAVTVSLSVNVSALRFPERLSVALGGWDYSDGPRSAYDAGGLDQREFIAKLRHYGVNMPWGGGQPAGAQFDGDGHMTRPPSFDPWDAWIAKWPDARYYGVFSLGTDFEGADPARPRTRRMVAEFLAAWVEHMKAQGLKNSQLCLLVSDEPRDAETDSSYVAWAELVREADLGVTIWVDPCHPDPLEADPRLYALSDVLSPSAARFVGSPQTYRDFFVAQQQRAGKELWFYSCVNGKHLDPITYHRGQFWLAIKYGAKGSSYWAFGDEGRAGSSLKAYTSPGHMFSPLFLDPQTGITDGKHMEAIREGAEDFETFTMLRERVTELRVGGDDSPELQRAEKLLIEGPERVCDTIAVELLDWRVPKDRRVMDDVRLEALECLEKLMRL